MSTALSGCGRSTLLNMIAGLDRPSAVYLRRRDTLGRLATDEYARFLPLAILQAPNS
ncbi:hypothetical protein ABT187_38200 [Streptomyces sp. NPDC001817]|uniref:hypothetical protein n=1 Tax=Streptomyces sp. NPDC001817 TaxID=3154398 RepID=UPI00331DC156